MNRTSQVLRRVKSHAKSLFAISQGLKTLKNFYVKLSSNVMSGGLAPQKDDYKFLIASYQTAVLQNIRVIFRLRILPRRL